MTTPERQEAIIGYLKGHFARVAVNLQRVGRLIEIGATHNTADAEELYRAATVLLYATLEDFLRYVASERLPACGADVLDFIPLAGSRDPLRPEKFLLGQLQTHRDVTVEELIRKSISSYVERMTYSDTNDVVRLFKLVQLKPDNYSAHFPVLQELMSRRHDVVHRADLGSRIVKEQRMPNVLEAAHVRNWNDAVLSFIAAVISDCMTPQLAGPGTSQAPNP